MNNVTTTNVVIGILVLVLGLFIFFGYLHRQPATTVEPRAPVVVRDTVATNHVKKIETVYVVKAGDTLSQIAEDQYGSWKAYVKIASVNKIKNPHLIYPGQTLSL